MSIQYSSLGIINNLSYKYGKVKQSINENNYYNDLSASSGSKRNLINTQNNKDSILESNQHQININSISNTNNNEMKVELTNWHLPPVYMETFDKCNDLFKELVIKLSKLQEEQQKRITPKFNDEENATLDSNIENISSEINTNLKKIENYILELKNESLESSQEAQIKGNMTQNLINKLNDFTKNLKNNQENYIRKFNELNGSDLLNNDLLNLNDDEYNKNSNMFLQNEMMEQKNNRLNDRNKEINNLLKTINELSNIYKDVQNLVLEQGSIVDRIDYNIEEAKDNTEKAKEQLIINEQKNKGSLIKKINFTLMFAIFVMAILLLFKIMH